jgi:hypothetical protein
MGELARELFTLKNSIMTYDIQRFKVLLEKAKEAGSKIAGKDIALFIG